MPVIDDVALSPSDDDAIRMENCMLFRILAAAMGMTIAITGLGYTTGYFPSAHPKMGYALLILGGLITIYYLNKMREK